LQAGKSFPAKSCNGAAEGQTDLNQINADNQRSGERNLFAGTGCCICSLAGSHRVGRFTIKLILGPHQMKCQNERNNKPR
jgi:hypothetical protein